jgi:hypothetical protein
MRNDGELPELNDPWRCRIHVRNYTGIVANFRVQLFESGATLRAQGTVLTGMDRRWRVGDALSATKNLNETHIPNQ